MSGAAKGVVVEFDFAAMNGAQLLFDVTQRYLKELDGIGLDMPTEEKFLVGRSYEEGLARYFKVVKTKKFDLRPMDVEEAILEMELVGHNFYVFLNMETDSVNVVYKRNDGNYGLLETSY